MGRSQKKKRVLARDFKTPRENTWEESSRRPDDFLDETDFKNAEFEEYYRRQGVVPEGEWEEFMRVLRQPLPASFRINGSGKFASDLRDRLENDFFAPFKQGPLEVEGEVLEPPKELEWYPGKLAWQFMYSRKQLRKLPALGEVHELLKRENEIGAITRQETVSMIPPLFLDVRPHHRVLDACAAPGSKTAQLVEALHHGAPLPTGVVVANDAEAQRCNLLTHQTKRFCSPALLVTNHDASNFPTVSDAQGKQLRFDRILCDVPCSGDGTLRKAPDIWRRWGVGMGLGLHGLQLRIALCAARALAAGGRMIYSTCTFNPVENEAVVAEILRQTGGALELLDMSAELPALRRIPGLRSWLVKDRSGFHASHADAVQAGNPQHLTPSMFPGADAESLPLHRCMRVLPHHANTGGFFISVFRKAADLPEPFDAGQWQRQGGARQRQGSRRPQSQKQQKAGDQGPSSSQTAGAAPHEAEVQDAAPGKAAEAAQAGEAALAQLAKAFKVPPPKVEEAEGKPTKKQRRDAESRLEGGKQVLAEGAHRIADTVGDFAEALERENIPAAAEAANKAAEAIEHLADVAEGDAEPAGDENNGGSEPGTSMPEVSGGGRGWGRQRRPRRRDAVTPFTDASALDSIADFYGFPAGFAFRDALVYRENTAPATSNVNSLPKRLYFVSPGLRELLEADEREALKINAAGLKVFDRQESKTGSVGRAQGQGLPCTYRLAQEGLHLLLPHITRQVVHLSVRDMLRLLTERYVALHAVPPEEGPNSGPVEEAAPMQEEVKPEDIMVNDATGELELRPEASAAPGQNGVACASTIADSGQAKVPFNESALLEELENTRSGCCVCRLRDEEAGRLGLALGKEGAEDAVIAAAPFAICAWRGRSSIAVLVNKAQTAQLAEKLAALVAKAEAKPGSGSTAP